jgi:hypothetical protein
MRLSFLTRREPLSCFPWEGGVNIFVAFVVLDPSEKQWRGPVVEKLRAAWVN